MKRLVSLVLVLSIVILSALVVHTSPAQAEGFGPGRVWHDRFAPGAERPAVGDVNRDGRDDLISFVQGSSGGELFADVWVSLSLGDRYGPAIKWHDWFALPGEVPLVGDVDADGDADIISFVMSARSDAYRSDVWVALSDGTRFGTAQRWHTDFGADAQIPLVGDFDGDRDVDIAMAVRSTYGVGHPYEGDVYVALSDRSRFGSATLWSNWFAPGQETPAVGDVDGDGDDDLVSFIGSTRTGEVEGDVWVARSNRTGFAAATKWADWFAPGGELPLVGDVDGDGTDDIVSFIRSSRTGQARADVWVAFGTPGGTTFGAPRLWLDTGAVGDEVPLLGDADGDGKDDAFGLVRATQPEPRLGDVTVHLAGDPWATPAPIALSRFGHGSMRVHGKPALGSRPLLTVFVNFSDAMVRAGTDRPQRYFEDLLFTGVPNLAQHYREMSGGRFTWANAGFRTVSYPDDSTTTTANESQWMCALAAGCPGTSSSDDRVLRTKIVQELLAPTINFASFDTYPYDRIIHPNELEFLLIDGRTGRAAANRSASTTCFMPRNQTVQVCTGMIAGVSQDTDYATIAHELGHSLGAEDLYDSGSNGAGLTLMSDTGSRSAMHMDPWHKLQLGWVEPRWYSVLESGSCAVLRAAHSGGANHTADRNPILLQDPYRPDEYFLLEFRSNNDYGPDPTRPDGWTSDGGVQGNGLVVWQVKTNGQYDDGIVRHTRLAESPGLHLAPGDNGRRDSVLGGDDVLDSPMAPATSWIVDGGNRKFESTVLGDDVLMTDSHVFPFNPTPNRSRTARTFTNLDGPVPVSYDSGWSPLVVQAGVPNQTPGMLYVKWSMHSFRGARNVSRLTPGLADCYRRVP